MRELQVAYIEKQQRAQQHRTGLSLYLAEIVKIVQLGEQAKGKVFKSGSYVQQISTRGSSIEAATIQMSRWCTVLSQVRLTSHGVNSRRQVTLHWMLTTYSRNSNSRELRMSMGFFRARKSQAEGPLCPRCGLLMTILLISHSHCRQLNIIE